jgi:peptide/nickel transport system ATP-binding protein
VTDLSVSGLTKEFVIRNRGRRHTLRAVDTVSFTLHSGHTVALVGESGSGKSTIARMLARLAVPTAGQIRLDGAPLPRGPRVLRRYRGQVQMVFQDPFGSLNPTHTVGYHLRRPLQLHGVANGRTETRQAVHQLLERVNLIPAGQIAERFPHELSGGQRQRVAIARALAPRPRILLADEPVSMLDVSIRLEILQLIDRLQREEDLGILYVTHDLATARYFASTVMVMYRGQIVEQGPSNQVILRPRHPYTQLLASAAPDPGSARTTTPGGMRALRGDAAPARTGCLFRTRCPSAMDVCAQPVPVFPLADSGAVRCWLYRDAAAVPD